jgi:hypothetical protein
MNATYRTNRADNDFDSYEYALAALKARYANRGVAGEAQSAVAEQKTREAASVRENPEAYRYGEIMEHDRYNRYRTGNGGSVMTVDDVHRIYKDETGKSVTAEVRRAALAAGNDSDARPASPYRVLETRSADSTNSDDFAGKTQLVQNGATESVAKVEYSEASAYKRVDGIIRKWFPGNKIVKANGKKSINPLSAIAMSLIFCIVLVVPITLSVMVHETSSDISELGEELREIETIADDLKVKLDDKNDLALIEDLAVNKYGMIKVEEGSSKYLRLNGMDMIESFDPNSDNSVMLALLNALGIRVTQE